MFAWETYLNRQKDQFVKGLLDFLRIPSISSMHDHIPHVQRAAEWVEARMKTAGIESVRIMPTGGQPVVCGDWLHAPGKPTVLIYGHFDTQPVDPLDLWDNPPLAFRTSASTRLTNSSGCPVSNRVKRLMECS